MARTRARARVWTRPGCSDIGSAAARGTSCSPLPLEMDEGRMRPSDGQRSPGPGAVVNAEKGVVSEGSNQFRGFNWEAWLANKKRYLNSCLKCNFPSA